MFYTFSQNNSGGSFDIDHKLAHFVIIEADSAAEANDLAESIGIYFNGCDSGLDCDCCGDRWYSQWDDKEGTAEPRIYDKDPQHYRCMFTAEGHAYCHVYYKDGLKRSYVQASRNAPAQIAETRQIPFG